MNRTFRFYEKKRGNRTTGSNSRGRVGQFIFFSFFFILGCAFLGIVFYGLILPEWRVNHDFLQHTCTILEKKLGESSGDDGKNTYRPEFRIRYKVADREYEILTTYDISGAYTSDRSTQQKILDRYEIDQETLCWYDPGNPNIAVLSQGYSFFTWLIMLLPLSFILVGGGGMAHSLLHSKTTAERRAALSKRVQKELDNWEGEGNGLEEVEEFPNIPLTEDVMNSPGTVLAYRLPGNSPGWQAVSLLLVSIFWNGIVSVFLVVIAKGHMEGNPEWFPTFFIIPFVLIGGVLIYSTIQALLVAAGVGPTIIEVSAHPFQADGEYEIYFSQSGKLSIQSIQVLLICEESATYRQGTNTHTAIERVHEEELYNKQGVEISQGFPLEERLSIKIPRDVMHSFASSRNRLNWSLRVKGEVARWPDFERTFSILIYPPSAEALSS